MGRRSNQLVWSRHQGCHSQSSCEEELAHPLMNMTIILWSIDHSFVLKWASGEVWFDLDIRRARLVWPRHQAVSLLERSAQWNCTMRTGQIYRWRGWAMGNEIQLLYLPLKKASIGVVFHYPLPILDIDISVYNEYIHVSFSMIWIHAKSKWGQITLF